MGLIVVLVFIPYRDLGIVLMMGFLCWLLTWFSMTRKALMSLDKLYTSFDKQGTDSEVVIARATMDDPLGVLGERKDVTLKYYNKVLDTCCQNGWLPYLGRVDLAVLDIYHNVTCIEHRLMEPSDYTPYARIRIYIHTPYVSDNIRSQEKTLYAKLWEILPEELDSLFSISYCVDPLDPDEKE